jgi:hypothetical protein
MIPLGIASNCRQYDLETLESDNDAIMRLHMREKERERERERERSYGSERRHAAISEKQNSSTGRGERGEEGASRVQQRYSRQ